MAAATNPIATPIKGLSTANQKEMFQSEFLGVGFFFMLFLKHWKIDISQNLKCFPTMHWAQYTTVAQSCSI
jgi:hypothetical protein